MIILIGKFEVSGWVWEVIKINVKFFDFIIIK